MGRPCYKKTKLSQKRFLMGNFIIQDQLENQEKEGRMLSGGKDHGFQEYEDGGERQEHRDKWRCLLREATAPKGIQCHRWVDSKDELPNTQAETFSEEQCNEHPATLTEMQASEEDSEMGKENSLVLNHALQKHDRFSRGLQT